MSSYKPPFARMRAIRAAAPPPLPRHPQNVEEALQQAAAAQAAGEPVEEIKVPVGAVEVTVTPGEDGKFGTDDDKVTIDKAPEPEVNPDEPLVTESEDDLDEEPEDDDDGDLAEDEGELVEDDEPGDDAKGKKKFNPFMKKGDLLAVAAEMGIDADDTMTKKQILAALEAAR